MIALFSSLKAKSVVQMKAQVDEESSQKMALGDEVVDLRDRLMNLGKQLDQRFIYLNGIPSVFSLVDLLFRPSEDDVEVLRKELIHAQTLMDTLTQEKEAEIHVWKKKHGESEMRAGETERTIELLTEQLGSTPKSDDILKLAVPRRLAYLHYSTILDYKALSKRVHTVFKVRWR